MEMVRKKSGLCAACDASVWHTDHVSSVNYHFSSNRSSNDLVLSKLQEICYFYYFRALWKSGDKGDSLEHD